MASRRVGRTASSTLKLARFASTSAVRSPSSKASSSSSSSSTSTPPPPSLASRPIPPPPIAQKTFRAPRPSRKQPPAPLDLRSDAERLATPDQIEKYNNRLAQIILSPPSTDSLPPLDSNSNDAPPPLSPLTSALLICREMVQSNIPPTPLTYSLLIQICLLAQSNRSIERTFPGGVDEEQEEEGRMASEEIKLERQYIREMTWLERRRKLLWQGQDPTGMGKQVRGAWFGSAEFEIGWGFYLDAEARGIKVPREGLDALMKMSHIHPSLTSRVSPLLSEPSTNPTSHSLELALLPYLSIPRHSSSPTDALADVDRILSIYADARAEGIFPSKEAVSQIILRLVAVGWSNAAVDMAADYEENMKAPSALLSPETWGNLMRAIVRKGKTSSLLAAWELSVNSGRLSPDVGLIQDCLLLFGKAGLPEIAIQLFTLLQSKGIPMAEHHYASVLQAWVKTDELENAFWTLALMRQDGVPPNANTATPLLSLILGLDRAPELAREVEEAVMRVDRAWFTLVESKEKRGVADVAAGNVILLACLSCADFVRTAETFNELATLDITPDLESYHHLLDACLLRPTETYPLFLKIQSLLQSNKITLTNKTYERLIAYLCEQPPLPPPTPEELLLRTASSPPLPPTAVQLLERALELLQELKDRPNWGPGWGQGPTRRTYEVLVMRMARSEDPRTGEMMKEMREMGYTVGKFLETYVWDRGGATLMMLKGEKEGVKDFTQVFGGRRLEEESGSAAALAEDLGIGKAHLPDRG